MPLFISPTRRIRAALLLPAALILAQILPANSTERTPLETEFLAQPESTRIAMQQHLAKADLFVGIADGKWNAATERALLRGANQVALASNGTVHPDLRRPAGLKGYLADLASGMFEDILAPHNRGWFSGN